MAISLAAQIECKLIAPRISARDTVFKSSIAQPISRHGTYLLSYSVQHNRQADPSCMSGLRGSSFCGLLSSRFSEISIGFPALHTRKNISMITRAGIHIDRRTHLEESFKRQKEAEDRAAEAEVTCPVDCVREVRTLAEFEVELQEAEAAKEIVLVDFYNSACGACKYMLPLFIKMCKKGCGEACDVEGHEGSVRYIKHNVRDDYDELTDLANMYKIRAVPMFSFFMDGCRIEQFPTRDRRRIEDTLGRLLNRQHSISAQELASLSLAVKDVGKPPTSS
eukprot:jgi/Mesen1/6473/ME000330S05491